MKQEVVILGGQTIDQKLSMTSWSSSIKIWFLQAYIVCIIKKNVMVWNRNAKIYAIGDWSEKK